MANFLIIGSPTYATRRILHELKLLRPNDNVGIVKPSNLFPQLGGKNQFKDGGFNPSFMARIDSTNSYGGKIDYETLGQVSCIIPRIGNNMSSNSKIINHFQLMGVPTTTDSQGLLNAHDKLLTFQRIEKNRVDSTPYYLPKTYSIDSDASKKESDRMIEYICQQLGGFPIVCKTVQGSQGKGVFLFESFLDAQVGVRKLLDSGHNVLLQSFIETGQKNVVNVTDVPRSDYRLVVIDGEVVASVKRIAPSSDFRTNLSQNGHCEGVILDKEYNNMAIDIARKTGLRCAGIDLAFEYDYRNHGKGDAYCYEANGNFNFEGTEEYSGVNVAKKIAELAVRIEKSPLKEDKPFNKDVFERVEGIGFISKTTRVYREGKRDSDRIETDVPNQQRSYYGSYWNANRFASASNVSEKSDLLEDNEKSFLGVDYFAPKQKAALDEIQSQFRRY